MKREYAIRLKLILISVLGIMFCGLVYAQDLDTEITVLSGKLSKGLIARGVKKVASADFVDLQGRPTELGRYLAEQLSVEMVNEENITVIDRANIKSILAEHNLTVEGLVKPENAKELGKIAGIDAILIGTVTTLDSDIVLTVKAISTETAQVVAAAKATFKNTPELQQLSNRVASNTSAASAVGDVDSTGKATYSDANSIATKDIGNLRVVLKSIRSVKGENGSQQAQMVFDFINISLKENVLVALASTYTGYSGCYQSQLIDSFGQAWELSRISGLDYVSGKGVHGDQLARQVMNGKHIIESSYSSGDVPWFGAFTDFPATQNKRVTMMFQKTGRLQYDKKIGDSVQFECELIVGNGSPEQPKNCYSTTVMFDNISLSIK